MSWFDASGFSSFAKTALSQAQNLQKSIDRVLDIDETGGAAPKPSASSKPKSTSSSLSNAKESLTTRKSSSSSSTTTASKSSRKTSSDLNNSKESDSEGNSFWSSFLGDSFSSTASNAESKTSSRRTSGRKLGSRSSSSTTVNEENVGVADDKNESEGVNSSKEKESNSSARSLKQHTKRNTNQTNTAIKSEGHLQASHALLSHHKDTTNGSKDLLNQDEDVTDFVNSQVVEDTSPEKAEFNTQELIVAPAKSGNKLKSERLKLSSNDKTHKGNKEVFTPGNDVSQSHNDSSLQDVSAVKNSEVSKEIKANASHEEPVSQSQSHNTETDVYSTLKGKPVESHNTNENALETTQTTDIISSDDVREGYSNVVSKPISSDLNGSSFVDSTDNVVFTDKTGQEIQQGPVEQNKFLDVEPLASSTPNHRVKEQSASLDHSTTKELTPTQPVDEYTQVSNQKEDALVYAAHESESSSIDTKEDKTVSEDVAEMFKEAASFVEDKQSTCSIPKQETEEIVCREVENAVEKLSQQPSTSNETAVPKETTEEKENNLMENDADSTHSSEDLKRKIEELQNEVANLKHVIEVRENKLVEVSKENVDLQEKSAILSSQLKQAEAALKAEDEEIEEVRQEFTVRVSATEKKFQAAAKERDQLRVLLEETEQSLGSRNDRQSEEFTTLLKEKDDQIAQLLDEGEKLSKQQLQSNNIVKKLRNKEKENDALIKKNNKSLEDMTSENTRLAEILQVKEETERKQADGITQLNAYVEKQEVQISKLKSELDDSAEKIRSMQAALDNAYKQLADLHKENASKDSAVQEAALSAEMTAKEGLRIAMEKKERQFKNEIEALEFQISDLQTALRRGEQQSSRREDNLRQEISDVQQRLQEAEARNQELTESVSYATRPLLRQIENLQSSYGNHTQTWERVERNLTERLSEAQIQLVEAQEKERVATEHALELNSRVTAVESQLATYRQDKSRLEATLEVERTRLETAEEARSREAARIETLEIKYRKMMEDNNVEKALLEQQLSVERGKMETEKKKFQHAMDEKERILLRQSSLPGAPPSPSTREEFPQDEFPEASPHRTLARQSSSNNVIDGMSRGLMGAGTAMIERLQAQVKQKDGEIGLLQEEITSLQKTRDAVTEELTSLTSKLECVEEDSRLLADLQTRHKELEQRHNAVLQMYGEKAEQAEELRMDLEDVKSMYKSQIQELLGASR